MGIVVVVSFFTQPKEASHLTHRDRYHHFLKEHTALPEAKKKWKTPVWTLTVSLVSSVPSAPLPSSAIRLIPPIGPWASLAVGMANRLVGHRLFYDVFAGL